MPKERTIISRAKIRMAHEIGHRLLRFGLRHARRPDGQIFDVSAASIGPIDLVALYLGMYERAEIDMVKKLEPAKTVIECGANIGVVTRYTALHAVAQNGTLICLEPDPKVHGVLQRNLQRTQTMRPDIQISFLAAALCTQAEEGQSLPFRQIMNLSSGLTQHRTESDGERVIYVPGVGLDTILRSHNLPDETNATLIMDCEGAEIDAIKISGASIKRVFSQAVIEFHDPSLTGRPETPEDMIGAMETVGYRKIARARNTVAFRRL